MQFCAHRHKITKTEISGGPKRNSILSVAAKGVAGPQAVRRSTISAFLGSWQWPLSWDGVFSLRGKCVVQPYERALQLGDQPVARAAAAAQVSPPGRAMYRNNRAFRISLLLAGKKGDLCIVLHYPRLPPRAAGTSILILTALLAKL